MRLIVNGDASDYAVTNLSGLLGVLDLDMRKVAIEHNLEIVPRTLFAATALADGDRIEIVHFIGGG